MKDKEIKKIKTLLRHINDYTEKLIDPQGVPENIVRDILQGHIRDFYERIDALDLSGLSSLKREDVSKEEVKQKETKEKAEENPVEQEDPSAADGRELEEMKQSLAMLKKQFEEIDKPTQSEKADEPEVEKEIPEAPPKTSRIPEENQAEGKKAEATYEEPKAPEKPAQSNSKTKRVIGEQFEDSKNSLNDFMSLKNGNHTIADRMKSNHISDLKSVIDINHKILFIRELFDGNGEEYKHTIERLNSAANLEEAASILDEFRTKYDWNNKEEALNIFNEIIHRKF